MEESRHPTCRKCRTKITSQVEESEMTNVSTAPMMPTPESNAARLQVLVDEGNVKIVTEENYDEFFGDGTGLWRDDEEFDAFMRHLAESRADKR